MALAGPAKQYTDGMSLYNYVKNQPLSNADPQGLVSLGGYNTCPIPFKGGSYDGLTICRGALYSFCAACRCPQCSPQKCSSAATNLLNTYGSKLTQWIQQNPGYHYCTDFADAIDGFNLSNECFTTEKIYDAPAGHAYVNVYSVCDKNKPLARLDPWHFGIWWGNVLSYKPSCSLY